MLRRPLVDDLLPEVGREAFGLNCGSSKGRRSSVAEAAAKQAATEREDLLRRVMAKEAGAMSRNALTLENRGLANRLLQSSAESGYAANPRGWNACKYTLQSQPARLSPAARPLLSLTVDGNFITRSLAGLPEFQQAQSR